MFPSWPVHMTPQRRNDDNGSFGMQQSHDRQHGSLVQTTQRQVSAHLKLIGQHDFLSEYYLVSQELYCFEKTEGYSLH